MNIYHNINVSDDEFNHWRLAIIYMGFFPSSFGEYIIIIKYLLSQRFFHLPSPPKLDRCHSSKVYIYRKRCLLRYNEFYYRRHLPVNVSIYSFPWTIVTYRVDCVMWSLDSDISGVTKHCPYYGSNWYGKIIHLSDKTRWCMRQ